MAKSRGVGESRSKGLGDRSTMRADAKKLTAQRQAEKDAYYDDNPAQQMIDEFSDNLKAGAMSRQEVDSIRRHDESKRDFIKSQLTARQATRGTGYTDKMLGPGHLITAARQDWSRESSNTEATMQMDDWENYKPRSSGEPLLDLFWKQCNRDKTYRPFRKLLQQCVAFHIDDKTSQHISDLSRQEPEDILKYLPSAKAPYDLTWIEFDLHVRGNYNYEIGTSPAVAGPDTPWRMGHLIRCETPERYVVYTVVSPTDNDPSLGLMPMVHMVNLGPEGPPEKMFDVPGIGESKEDGMIAVWQAKSTAWGWISVDGSVRLPKEANNHYNLGVDPEFLRRMTATGKGAQVGNVLRSSTEETSGDIRWLVCLLAAINEVPTVVGDLTRTPGKFAGGGKVQPFLSHRTVQLQIGREMKVTRLHKIIVNAAKKRAHRVRRHLRVYYRGTEKEFSVWVEPHVRGDASLGWVHQDYEVTS